MNKKAFTLIELMIVIIIVGILAVVGLNQYSKQVEVGRTSEARAIWGHLAKRVMEYYLNGGVLSSITNADVGIGTASTDIPSACRSTNYYRYTVSGSYTATTMWLHAYRCTSGGKEPQGSPWYYIAAHVNSNAGIYGFACQSAATSSAWVFTNNFTPCW